MTLPLLVVEGGRAALEDARAELSALGWDHVTESVVTDDAGAAEVVLAALAGRPVLVEARAPREVVDRLCDDLRRLGHLDHRVGQDGLLSAEQHALLGLLARGTSLGDAASALHLSRRSADRRLAAAREVLGAASTSAAVASYLARLARLPQPGS